MIRLTILATFAIVTLVAAGSANAALLTYYVDGSSADAAALVNLTTPSGYTASSLSSIGLRNPDYTTSLQGSLYSPGSNEWLFAIANQVVNTTTPGSADDYYEFSVTVTGGSGNTIDPTSLTFDYALFVNGNNSTITGYYQVYASTNGSTFSAVGSVGSLTVPIPPEGGTFTATEGPYLQNIDLTSLAAAESYTFRIALGDNSGVSNKGHFLQAIQLHGDVAVPSDPPMIVSTLPTDNDTVPPPMSLQVTFDQAITTNTTGNITLTNITAQTSDIIPVGSAEIAIAVSVLTITPDDAIAINSDYAVLVDNNAIKGVGSGVGFAGIADTTTWNFTTTVPDTTRPEIVPPLSPADGAYVASFGLSLELVATFNEPVLIDSGSIVITNLTDGSAITIALPDPSQVWIDSGTNLTINPNLRLRSSSDYAVLISTNAVTDLAFNPNYFAGFTNLTSWNFTTATSLTYYGDGSSADSAATANLTTPSAYTASALSSVGLQGADYTTSDQAGFSSPGGTEWLYATAGNVGSTPGSTDHYYQFSVTGTDGNTIDPTSLAFDWAVFVRGNTSGMTGQYQVYASTDGSTFSAVGSVGDLTVPIPPEGGSIYATVGPYPQNIVLTSLAAAESYTFRIALGDNSDQNAKGQFLQAIQLNGGVKNKPPVGTVLSVR